MTMRTYQVRRPIRAAGKKTASPTRPRAGRPQDLKIRQILDGARAVFLADGFDGASMNDIAARAGVSKGTLYVYFASKVALFEALIRHDRNLQAEELFQFGEPDADIEKVLVRVGMGMMEQMCRADTLAHLRMVIGAVAKYPEIGKAFFEAGPRAAVQNLGAYLMRQARAGRLKFPTGDEGCATAADQFIQLCQTDYYKAALFCAAPPDDADALARAVTAAVKTFLRAYGA